MTLPELATLVVRAGCLLDPDDNRFDCPPDVPCSSCLMWNTPTKRCLFWDQFQADYQSSTLAPYLRIHHPEFFV